MSIKARHITIYFLNELNDVFKMHPYTFDIQIEDENNFSELFPTSIILGMRYDKNIKKSLQTIRNARLEIQNALDQLEQEKINVKEALDGFDEKHRALIINS